MQIKKAELHVHLEGTIPPRIARILATRNNLPFPDELVAPDGNSYSSRDFLHFLQVYDTLAALIKKPEDYYDITFDYLKERSLEDAIYVEMMYSPDHAERASNIPSIEHLHAIQQAIDDAKSKHNIVGRIIVTAVRHYGAESATQVAKAIAKNSVPCVVGFGLGGDEINYPPELFANAFHIADKEAGLQCTAHAGEFAPASGIDKAIETLPLKRIGHGVRAIESPDTLKRIKDKGIALEICPSSNVILGLFPDIKSHPLPKLLDMGIICSLNSDDPPFMQTTLGLEYQKAEDILGLSVESLQRITRMAIESSFADEELKQQLLKQC